MMKKKNMKTSNRQVSCVGSDLPVIRVHKSPCRCGYVSAAVGARRCEALGGRSRHFCDISLEPIGGHRRLAEEHPSRAFWSRREYRDAGRGGRARARADVRDVTLRHAWRGRSEPFFGVRDHRVAASNTNKSAPRQRHGARRDLCHRRFTKALSHFLRENKLAGYQSEWLSPPMDTCSPKKSAVRSRPLGRSGNLLGANRKNNSPAWSGHSCPRVDALCLGTDGTALFTALVLPAEGYYMRRITRSSVPDQARNTPNATFYDHMENKVKLAAKKLRSLSSTRRQFKPDHRYFAQVRPQRSTDVTSRLGHLGIDSSCWTASNVDRLDGR
ncbi:hypothetical protein EVAR_21401_1 [Eumeta japonica]|uniref:Uncharacterized protein n=1 Tax=Eumeta variegata TaxID=151549 RepID=A0A4C1VG47_EUMVA|nr:hypothetical protein EVAR_21401_1 [Eumeta japonica]